MHDTASAGQSRRLAAIVFLDIVGYTALMEKNEAEALAHLAIFEQTIVTEVKEAGGEVASFYGDGGLLVFGTASAAVSCSLRIQRRYLESEPPIPVRIGIHVGELVYRDGLQDTLELFHEKV